MTESDAYPPKQAKEQQGGCSLVYEVKMFEGSAQRLSNANSEDAYRQPRLHRQANHRLLTPPSGIATCLEIASREQVAFANPPADAHATCSLCHLLRY